MKRKLKMNKVACRSSRCLAFVALATRSGRLAFDEGAERYSEISIFGKIVGKYLPHPVPVEVDRSGDAQYREARDESQRFGTPARQDRHQAPRPGATACAATTMIR